MANELRDPRFQVFLGSTLMSNVIDCSVSNDDAFTAGRFTIIVAAAASDVPLWIAGRSLVEIVISVDGQRLSLISGYIDEIQYDPIVCHIEAQGRDLAALPLAGLRTQVYENQSAAEVATSVAAQYGLTAVIDRAAGLYGRYFQANTSKSVFSQYSKFQTDWDILTAVARSVNAGLWVDGQSLIIAPIHPTIPQYTMTPSDCTAMTFGYQLDLATGIMITVQSWDSYSEAMVSASSTSGDSANARRVIKMTVPNIKGAEASSLCGYLLSEMTNHTTTVNIEMPGELNLAPRASFLLSGTSTTFDGMYIVRQMERQFSFQRGFTQSLQAYQVTWMP
jgi:hypothetical protein